MLISASNQLESLLRRGVSYATFKRSLLSGRQVNNAQPIEDLTGNGLFAFFDAPWFPIYIGVMFPLHSMFGIAGVISGVVMGALAIATEKAAGMPLKEANSIANKVTSQFWGSLRNAE